MFGRRNKGRYCPRRGFLGRFFKRRFSMEPRAITCECLKCGATASTEGHCIDMGCPKCGGQMRRADRPGVGR